MADFRTKIDLGDNRQGIQRIHTITDLSGTTVFGTEFSALTSGVDLTTIIITGTLTGQTSTFSGNTDVTNITFGDSRMVVASESLDPITNLNSGDTQTALGFIGVGAYELDGNTIYSGYTGSTYDFTVTSIEDDGLSGWTGTAISDVVLFYSGSSLDYSERLIWVDVQGITKTERLILSDEPEIITGVTTVLARDTSGDVVQVNISGSVDKNYVHDQGLPSSVWTVTHGLNKYPSVSVVDNTTTLVEGQIIYLDSNNVVLTFQGAFSGKAIFN